MTQCSSNEPCGRGKCCEVVQTAPFHQMCTSFAQSCSTLNGEKDLDADCTYSPECATQCCKNSSCVAESTGCAFEPLISTALLAVAIAGALLLVFALSALIMCLCCRQWKKRRNKKKRRKQSQAKSKPHTQEGMRAEPLSPATPETISPPPRKLKKWRVRPIKITKLASMPPLRPGQPAPPPPPPKKQKQQTNKNSKENKRAKPQKQDSRLSLRKETSVGEGPSLVEAPSLVEEPLAALSRFEPIWASPDVGRQLVEPEEEELDLGGPGGGAGGSVAAFMI